MKKPDLLRAAIARILPEVERDYDKLAMWVEKGSVKGRLGPNHGFAWEYELTVLASGYTNDPAVLFFVITEWLRDQQPELLTPGAPGFSFEVDVLAERSWDIQIVIKLDECVDAFAADTPGAWNLAVRDAQVPIDPDALPLRDTSGPVTSIWAHGAQIAPPAP